MANQIKGQFLLFFLTSFFVVTFITASMYNNITINAGAWLIFGVGNFTFMFGKSALDIIQEFWGRKQRRQVVLNAMIVRAIFFFITIGALAVGDASPGTHEFLGSLLRLMIAAEVVLFIGQYYVDPFLYTKTSKWLKGRSPFLRGTVSNSIGSILMSPIYAFIGFYGMRPDDFVMKIAFGGIVQKLPTILIASAVAAVAIYMIRKTMGLASMVETNGKDHN